MEYWDGDILWVTSKDIKSKYIISSQLRLSTLGANQMRIYQPNTLLLVTRSGILRHSLPVAILKKCATINQDLKAIVLYMPQSAEYIYVCLKGMEPRLLLEYTKSGTTVENVNFAEFQKVLLPIAPVQQINRIITATNNAIQLISTVEDNKVALISYWAKAKSKILDLAIRGKLVPQDPNDEPASVLLERIRTEKEELIKQGKIKRDKKESVIFKGDDNSYYLSDDSLPLNMPFVIPENWTWCTLQELCNYGDCINISSENIPANGWILDLEDIEKDSGKVIHRLTNCQRPSTSAKHKFSKNMVLYSRLRPYLNKVILADADGYCTSEILPLKFAKEICPRYAQIFLMSPFFVEYANLCSYGMKMPRLGTKDGQKAYFALPPYEEQLKIAHFVDSLFNKLQTIENNIT